MASPTIYRPAPTLSPDAPPKKKPRTESPTPTAKIPTQYFRIDTDSEYPLHEKYDSRTSTLSSTRQSSRPTDSSEKTKTTTSAYQFFVYHRDNQHWTLVKGPTSKYHDERWYSYIEMLVEKGSLPSRLTQNIGTTSWRNLAVTP